MIVNDLFGPKKNLAEGIHDDDYEDCSYCSGTGEGKYEGSSCSHCGGSGVEPSSNDDDVDVDDDWYDNSEEPESYYEKSLRSRGLGEQSVEEGDVAKLAGITALGIGAGLGANYLDQQQPRVEFDGKNGQVVRAYLEPAWTNRVPDNAMVIKGKDGKTYHVWSSAGKGMNSKSYHAAPVEPVKEGADERKQNALWAQITAHEKAAKKSKDLKQQHHLKMADQLRSQLKTSDKEQGVAEGSLQSQIGDIELTDFYLTDETGKILAGPFDGRNDAMPAYRKLASQGVDVDLIQGRALIMKLHGLREQGVAEGTVYPNAEVIKSKNGKPVGEIYQDGNSWGCFHYKADRGYDMIDSREDAIEALKDLHQETGRSRPDYTIKGVAESTEQNPYQDGYQAWSDYLSGRGSKTHPVCPYKAGHGMHAWEQGAEAAYNELARDSNEINRHDEEPSNMWEGVEEGSYTKTPSGDYINQHTGVRSSTAPKQKPVRGYKWEVNFDYGPHQTTSVKVTASSENEACAKAEKLAEKNGYRSIMINWAKPAEQGVAETRR